MIEKIKGWWRSVSPSPTKELNSLDLETVVFQFEQIIHQNDPLTSDDISRVAVKNIAAEIFKSQSFFIERTRLNEQQEKVIIKVLVKRLDY
jgi:hypothetical protein